MKISAQKIDQLYKFTRQHYVEYYDLQTELVDHLANAIEIELAQNPKLNFEEALQIEFKKFGVFGFMDVVEERQKALSKKHNKLVWHHFRAFFSVPKIMLTAFLIFSLFYFIKIFHFIEFIYMIFVIVLIITFISLYHSNKKIKKRKQKTGKIWLFQQIIFGYGAFSGVLMLPFHFLNMFSSNQSSFLQNDYVLFGLSFLSISILLMTYTIIKIIP